MPEGQFDKDFGYLIPFLDKVAAAANNLSDAAAREELKKIMADEKSRWARIRQLLSGAAGNAQGAPSPSVAALPSVASSSVAPPSVASSPAVAVGSQNYASKPVEQSAREKDSLSFTVGSLRPRAR
jgi:hypothetical protein